MGHSHTCYHHFTWISPCWVVPEHRHDPKQQKEGSEGEAAIEEEGVNRRA
jgi:hypothetical protein